MRAFSQFLLLTAFILQAFIPVGFMPSFSGGQMTIEICSGITGEIIEIEYGEENAPQNHDSFASDLCPYTSTVAYVHPALPPALNGSAYISLAPAALESALWAPQNHPSFYTRGPPAISPA